MTRTCEVKNCLAAAERHERACKTHLLARSAKELCIPCGKGGASCVACRRKFKHTDHVLCALVATKKRRVESFGWKHAICEPKRAAVSRKVRRDAPKPLFAGL